MVKDNLAYQIVATPKDEIVIDEIPVKWCTVSLSEIIERGMRLEASVYDVEAKQAREIITNGKYPPTTLGGADGMTTSYTGARFKRIWVEKSDYPIYQPSSIMDIKPSPDGYISAVTDTDVLRQQSDFISLTQRQKEQCEECYKELTPYHITSILASGEVTKRMGAYNFINDAGKISEAIVIILYMLRCCLAHGDISPDESANEVLCAPLRKLK